MPICVVVQALWTCAIGGGHDGDHGGTNADKFTTDGPYFLAVHLTEGEILTTNEQV